MTPLRRSGVALLATLLCSFYLTAGPAQAAHKPHKSHHSHKSHIAHDSHRSRNLKVTLNYTFAPTCQVKVPAKHGRLKTLTTFDGWQRRMVVHLRLVKKPGAKKEKVHFQCDSATSTRTVRAGYRPAKRPPRVTFLPLRSGEEATRNIVESADTPPVVPSGEELGGGRYPNAKIADVALAQLNKNIGIECKPAVNQWVSDASGHTQNVSGGYYLPYLQAGGQLVQRDQAVKGDIIQLYLTTDQKAYHTPMHTAVVLSHTPGSNTFDVVDSNYHFDTTVREHLYDPYAKAAAANQVGVPVAVAIWRLGEVDIPQAPSNTPTPPPVTANPTPPASPATHTVTETAGTTAHTWTNYTNAGGAQGLSISAHQSVEVACKLVGFKVSDGNTWWYRIASNPWNGQYYVSADAFYNNGATSGSLSGTPYVDGTVPDCGSTPSGGGAGGGGTRTETVGTVAHSWTNYANAGGSQGPDIAKGQSVQISCKVTGFRVSDGNTWWYRIASSPWNNGFYVSADAFYNNGATTGSLSGTPFVDGAVPNC